MNGGSEELRAIKRRQPGGAWKIMRLIDNSDGGLAGQETRK